MEPVDLDKLVVLMREERMLSAAALVGRVENACAQPFGVDRTEVARLAHWVGAPRLSRLLHILNYRNDRADGRRFVYFCYAYLCSRGALPVMRAIRERLETDPTLSETDRSDLLALQAWLYVHFRDFETANRHLKHADELTPSRPWLQVQRAGVLAADDRYEEALEWARRSLEEHPFYRPGVLEVCDLLVMLNREDEVEALLSEADKATENSAYAVRLVNFYSEREDHVRAMAFLDRYETLTPWREKDSEEWLNGRRADLFILGDDMDAALAHAEKAGEGFHEKLAAQLRLEENKNGKRVRLPVPFVRQHNVTCAPATLAALCRYWDREAPHLEIAEQICYDGTPMYHERCWAQEQGFHTREFEVTWSIVGEVIDRGIPFTLGTIEPTSAHLQAVIGYDSRAGLMIMRDPTYAHYTESLAEAFLKDYGGSGPRGMLLLPASEAHRLEGLDLPASDLYDAFHELNGALEEHDREKAEEFLKQMEVEDPDHRLTWWARRALAFYDRNPNRRMECGEKLAEMFPDDVSIRYACFQSRIHLRTSEEQRVFLKEELDREDPHPVFAMEYARNLAADGRVSSDARRALLHAHRLMPRDADVILGLAQLAWEARELETAFEYYRLAACAEDRKEYYASAYFDAARRINRPGEALDFLRSRVRSSGSKSSGPAIALAEAYESLEREEDAFAVLDEALARMPDDGDLLLFTAGRHGFYGQLAKARDLLERAQGRAVSSAWNREAARLASMEEDWPACRRHWEAVLQQEPLAMDAYRACAQMVAETESTDAAVEYLEEARQRYPHFYPLHELLVEWLRHAAHPKTVPVLTNLIEADPTNQWAVNELALEKLRLGDLEAARETAEKAVALAPLRASAHAILGGVLSALGEKKAARESLERSIRISVDQPQAMDWLLDATANREEREEILAFLKSELVSQVTMGEALVSFYRVAYPHVAPEKMLETLQEANKERPDLWQSWSMLTEHYVAMDRLGEALETVKEAARRFPWLAEIHYDVADVHSARREAAEQIDALNQALALRPGWPPALRRLASVLDKEGRTEEAIAAARRTVRNDPLTPNNHGVLAELLHRVGRPEDAWDSVRDAVLAHPGYSWGWERLGEWSQALDREDDFLKLASRMTESRPEEARSWATYSEALETLERNDEALEAIGQGLDRDPKNVRLHDMRAMALLRMGRVREAVKACAPASFGNEVPRELQGRAAWILWSGGKRKEAVEKMEEVLKDEPHYLWGTEQLCDWHGEMGEHEKALTTARQLTRLEPDMPAAWGYAGSALLELDRQDEAGEAFAKAVSIDPSYEFGVNHLLELHVEKEDFKAATAVVERAERFVSKPRQLALRLRLAQLAKNEDAARKILEELCATGEEGWGITVAMESRLEQSPWSQLWKSVLEEQMSAGNVTNPGAVIAWANRQPARKWQKQITKLLGFDLPELARDHGCRVILNRALENGAHDAAATIVANHRELFSGSNLLWGIAGRVYNQTGRDDEAIRWLSDWRERKDVEPWMLLNLVHSLDSSRGPLAAYPIRKHILENMPPYDEAYLQEIGLAFVESRKGEREHSWQLLAGRNLDQIPPYYGFIHCLSQIQMAATDPDLASTRREENLAGLWNKATALWQGWRDDSGLVRHVEATKSFLDERVPGMRFNKTLHKALRGKSVFGERWMRVLWVGCIVAIWLALRTSGCTE